MSREKEIVLFVLSSLHVGADSDWTENVLVLALLLSLG